jgi:hypothetical protein
MENNPYAPPVQASQPLSPPGDVFFFREGDFLVVRDGAVLPTVCLRTNEPAGEGSWRMKVGIAWTPPWVFLLILLNILVLLIVALVTQKKAKITYSLSAAVRGSIVRKRGIGFFLLLAAVTLFYFGITSSYESTGAYFQGGVAALIVALVFFVIANPLKVVKHREGWFGIKGCSKEFLETLPVYFYPF